MNDALMAQLRESLLLERARKIYLIVDLAQGDEGIDAIKEILRTTRDEGIAAGLDQADRLAEWRSQPAYQEVVAGIRNARKAQGKS